MLGDTSCISYSKKNPRVNKDKMMMMMMIHQMKAYRAGY